MALYQRVKYIEPNGSTPILANGATAVGLGSSLFITPRNFVYNTYAGPGHYNLDRQGLVALLAHDPTPPWGAYYENAGYRVITRGDGKMDPIPFAQVMSALCAYGHADEGLSHSARLDVAKTRPLEMRCGHVSQFVMNCAASLGIFIRQVHLLNVTSPNYYDDGHVANEIKIDGRMAFVDIPNDVLFRNPDGSVANLAEIIPAGGPSAFPEELLAQHRIGRSTYPSVLSAFAETTFRTHQDIMAWCNRVYEVPGMFNPATQGIVWGVPPHLSSYASYIANYPGSGGLWTTMPLADWVAAHY